MDPEENAAGNYEANNNDAEIPDEPDADEEAVNAFLMEVEMVNQQILDEVEMEPMGPEIVHDDVLNDNGLDPQIHAQHNAMEANFMSGFIGHIEDLFERYGQFLAIHPKKMIFMWAIIILASMNGLFFFKQEKNPLNLWIPRHSDFFIDTKWLMQEFGDGLRVQTILITAPDVLQPSIMNQLLDIHLKLVNSTIFPSWQDVCFKVPIISFNVQEPRIKRDMEDGREVPKYKRTEPFNQSFSIGEISKVNRVISKQQTLQQIMTDETFDPSLILGKELYCNIVDNFPTGCLSQNIVDIWKFDKNEINSLTKTKLIADLNTTTFSPTLGHPIPFTSLLGGIEYDENGTIVSAQALMAMYMVHVNFSTVDMDTAGNDGGTADWANGPGLEWESHFIKILSESVNSVSGFELYYEAGRSFGDISAAGMFQDMDKLIIGVVLMLIYIQAQQTRASCVSSRMIPAMVGLLCIGIAFLMSVALCSAFRIPYGPVHTSLPFLLLGIGVDDMFVISSCWNALSIEDKISSIPVRMGLTMRHAGLSISVTSATDAVAFLIGSITGLPSLSSFCCYAAVGICMTFALQISLFVIALALDQQRVEAGRNFLIPCIKQAPPKLLDMEYTPHCSNSLKFIYSKFIMTKIGKITVATITLFFSILSFYGNANIEPDFKAEWFLDEGSYLSKFLGRRDEYFPHIGSAAGVYFGQLQYNEELQNIGHLVENLKQQKEIVMNVEEWWSGFQRYVQAHFNKDIEVDFMADEEFRQYISDFLFSPTGARFQKNFRFSEILECGKPAPNITVAFIEFQFRRFDHSASNVWAMNTVKELVSAANLTSGDQVAFVWAKAFANFVTDEIILQELLRNLLLAIGAVGATTFFFLGSTIAVLGVLSCVVMALTNTIGFMFLWGMSIELVSTIALVLAVGLTVDFTAHIAYAFMRVGGSGDERAIHAVTYMGGAVLHGGMTTLLALSVLVFSHSFIFTAFFKIFLLVIFFGLFYGLLFLPVAFSLLRPLQYFVRNKQQRRNSDEQAEDEIEIPTPPERPATGRGL